MAAVQMVPRSEVEPVKESRHCPQCGKTYQCKPGWHQHICPTCNGQRIAQARAQRRDGMPTVPPVVPEPEPEADIEPVLRDLDLEMMAMRNTANWLEDLDGSSRARVMAWLWSRYGG